MLKFFLNKFKKLIKPAAPRDWENPNLLLAAKSLMSASTWLEKPNFSSSKWIQDKEFQVYSQFGDDGIIQWLIFFLNLRRKGRFIEFGVGDYFESITHFLLINNRWEGFVMDGDEQNVNEVKTSPLYWRYKFNAKKSFVTKDNVESLLNQSNFDKIELLHVDLDGNDYWILDALNLNRFNPDILILEYNAIFGFDRAITVPYNQNFYRMQAHFSGKYFGASLPALNYIATKKGYYFIGCNSAGNNAYFLSNKYISTVPKADLLSGYQSAGYREARNKQGQLIYSDSIEELNAIKGLPVVDVISGKKEHL